MLMEAVSKMEVDAELKNCPEDESEESSDLCSI